MVYDDCTTPPLRELGLSEFYSANSFRCGTQSVPHLYYQCFAFVSVWICVFVCLLTAFDWPK